MHLNHGPGEWNFFSHLVEKKPLKIGLRVDSWLIKALSNNVARDKVRFNDGRIGAVIRQ